MLHNTCFIYIAEGPLNDICLPNLCGFEFLLNRGNTCIMAFCHIQYAYNNQCNTRCFYNCMWYWLHFSIKTMLRNTCFIYIAEGSLNNIYLPYLCGIEFLLNRGNIEFLFNRGNTCIMELCHIQYVYNNQCNTMCFYNGIVKFRLPSVSTFRWAKTQTAQYLVDKEKNIGCLSDTKGILNDCRALRIPDAHRVMPWSETLHAGT